MSAQFTEAIAAIRAEREMLTARLANLQIAEETLLRLSGASSPPPRADAGKSPADPPKDAQRGRRAPSETVKKVAAVMARLDRPASTTEIATELSVTTPAISHHFNTNPGWFQRRGGGAMTRYTLTDLGRADLLHGSDPMESPSGTRTNPDGSGN